jgi:replicative DNA helicase
MQLQILTVAMNSGLQYGSPREALNAISEKLQRLNHCEISQQSVIRAYEAIADDFLNTPDVGSDFIQTSIEGLPEVPNRGLITIAGRSGHGKTFFAIYLMDAIIDKIPGKQSLYFNLEMSETVMLERHAKLLGYSGKNRRETIELALPQLLLKNISLVSVPMITIDEIEAHCRLAALKMPLGVVVVDYLGLIKSRSRSERKDLEQSDIAKRLAAIALSLDCIVIALIQVNREFKNRPVGERCPVVSDSAESMGSVHSSSWWLGIDRPELDSDDPEWRGLYQLRARKNRGESGLFALDFNFVDGMFSFRPKRFDQRYSGYSAGF